MFHASSQPVRSRMRRCLAVQGPGVSRLYVDTGGRSGEEGSKRSKQTNLPRFRLLRGGGGDCLRECVRVFSLRWWSDKRRLRRPSP